MLEIVISILIILGVVVWFLKSPRKQKPAPKNPVDFVCTHCGEKDCHCQRRS